MSDMMHESLMNLIDTTILGGIFLIMASICGAFFIDAIQKVVNGYKNGDEKAIHSGAVSFGVGISMMLISLFIALIFIAQICITPVIWKVIEKLH